MNIEQFSSNVILRISSFLDEKSCENFSCISSYISEILKSRYHFELLASFVRSHYQMIQPNLHDPLWLALEDNRVVILLGERHHNSYHKRINSIVARLYCFSPTVYLTEFPPPAIDQIDLPNTVCNRMYRWENEQLYSSIDQVIYPKLVWIDTLKRFYRMAGSHVTRKSIQIKIDKVYREVFAFIAKKNSEREYYLVQSIKGVLQKKQRPIVIAGLGHLKYRKNEFTTLDRLNELKIPYISLIPKQLE